MSATIDYAVVERSRASFAGLAEPTQSGVPDVPDILVCTFDQWADAFRVVYFDQSVLTLRRGELADVGDSAVVAWSVDEFHRGVEVVLEDGVVTSFSAEFPRYLRDKEYRGKVDTRFERRDGDIGLRVAARVRGIREERGWSVAELARRCKMAAPNVHRLESGKHAPTTRTLVRVAEALEVPLDRLLRE